MVFTLDSSLRLRTVCMHEDIDEMVSKMHTHCVVPYIVPNEVLASQYKRLTCTHDVMKRLRVVLLH